MNFLPGALTTVFAVESTHTSPDAFPPTWMEPVVSLMTVPDTRNSSVPAGQIVPEISVGRNGLMTVIFPFAHLIFDVVLNGMHAGFIW